MKIGLLSQPLDPKTPWGGANTIYCRIIERLQTNHIVSMYHPNEQFDLIYSHDSKGLNNLHALNLPGNIPILVRIGDVGTHGKPHIPEYIKQSHKYKNISYIITSHWAANYLLDAGALDSTLAANDMNLVGERCPIHCKHKHYTYIIQNAADETYFPIKKLKIVTHHWSDNPLKGNDIYYMLDFYTSYGYIEFTFIGRPSFRHNYATIKPPMTKDELAKELVQHDWYLTASRLEAGANHVLEAQNLGLPILYHTEGGSIPEYVIRGIPYANELELAQLIRPPEQLTKTVDSYIRIIERHGT